MARHGSGAAKLGTMALVSFEAEVGEGGYYGELAIQGVGAGGTEQAAQYALSPTQCQALADELRKLTVRLAKLH